MYLSSLQKKMHNFVSIALRLLQLGYLPFSSVSSDGNAKLNSIIGWFNVFLLFMACTDRVQSYTIHFTNRRFVPLYSAYILYPGEHCVTSKFHILQLFCPLILTMSFVLSKLNGNECALKLFCIQFSWQIEALATVFTLCCLSTCEMCTYSPRTVLSMLVQTYHKKTLGLAELWFVCMCCCCCICLKEQSFKWDQLLCWCIIFLLKI